MKHLGKKHIALDENKHTQIPSYFSLKGPESFCVDSQEKKKRDWTLL